jgi:hypothetical protein
MSKLSEYLEKNKIDSRRVVIASRNIEALQPEDRAIRLARAQVKAGDEKPKELAAKKRRSGRALSAPALKRALNGETLTRKARGRIVRAVNLLLGHKGKAEATSLDLF